MDNSVVDSMLDRIDQLLTESCHQSSWHLHLLPSARTVGRTRESTRNIAAWMHRRVGRFEVRLSRNVPRPNLRQSGTAADFLTLVWAVADVSDHLYWRMYLGGDHSRVWHFQLTANKKHMSKHTKQRYCDLCFNLCHMALCIFDICLKHDISIWRTKMVNIHSYLSLFLRVQTRKDKIQLYALYKVYILIFSYYIYCQMKSSTLT